MEREASIIRALTVMEERAQNPVIVSGRAIFTAETQKEVTV